MTNPGVYHLFVYGSLRSGFRNPMYEYISRFFRFCGEATVKGKLFDMGQYAAAIPADQGSIIGELYEANQPSEFAWAIGQLDDYEGLNAEAGEVSLYTRSLVEVNCQGKVYQSWIYWFCGDTAGQPVIESGDMLEYIKSRQGI